MGDGFMGAFASARAAIPVGLCMMIVARGTTSRELASSTPSPTTVTTTSTGTPSLIASGIEGQILLGPTCPVEREGMPCERPYKATVVVWNAARTQKVLTFSSDDEGRFRVSLAPGDYYLDPQSSGEVLPRPIPQ